MTASTIAALAASRTGQTVRHRSHALAEQTDHLVATLLVYPAHLALNDRLATEAVVNICGGGKKQNYPD